MSLQQGFESLSRRDVALWALVALVIVAQLAAFWMVCLSQVKQAQARHENMLVEQRAVEECVRRNSQASLVSCADRATDQRSAVPPDGRHDGVVAAAR